jgi:hypothetical protein|tara:strand:- start:101 stop:472 length:372 start_codon:yes stop_codon:yes gene_type:complete
LILASQGFKALGLGIASLLCDDMNGAFLIRKKQGEREGSPVEFPGRSREFGMLVLGIDRGAHVLKFLQPSCNTLLIAALTTDTHAGRKGNSQYDDGSSPEQNAPSMQLATCNGTPSQRSRATK